MSLIQMN